VRGMTEIPGQKRTRGTGALRKRGRGKFKRDYTPGLPDQVFPCVGQGG